MKTIIFDLDGVIVNTEPMHLKAYQKAFNKNGYSLTESDYNRELRSKGRKRGFERLLCNYNKEIMDKIGEDKDNIYKNMVATEQLTVYEDAIWLIKKCVKENITLGIGTASSLGNVVLEKLNINSYFKAVVTADRITNNKPDPEIYNLCCQLLGSEKNKTTVIEDSESGVIAALDAGLKVIYIKREGSPDISSYYLNNPKVLTVTDLKIDLINL